MLPAPSAFKDDNQEYFIRRVFKVKKDDYKAYKSRDYFPLEAVSTESIQPKLKGVFPCKKSQIAVRFSKPLMQKLEIYIQQTGLSKTEVVNNALAQYLDFTSEISLVQRVTNLERIIADIEAKY